MAKQKLIAVTERTHEILRRESLSLSLANTPDGNVSMGDIISDTAEKIQKRRAYKALPEKEGVN